MALCFNLPLSPRLEDNLPWWGDMEDVTAVFVSFLLWEQGASFTCHGIRKLDCFFHSTSSERTLVSCVVREWERKKDQSGCEHGRGLKFESSDLLQSWSEFNPLVNSSPKHQCSVGMLQFILWAVWSPRGTHLNQAVTSKNTAGFMFEGKPKAKCTGACKDQGTVHHKVLFWSAFPRFHCLKAQLKLPLPQNLFGTALRRAEDSHAPCHPKAPNLKGPAKLWRRWEIMHLQRQQRQSGAGEKEHPKLK